MSASKELTDIMLKGCSLVVVLQYGQDIMVIKHETNREGQELFGELEESDGIE
jgi:hypothetical protein